MAARRTERAARARRDLKRAFAPPATPLERGHRVLEAVDPVHEDRPLTLEVLRQHDPGGASLSATIATLVPISSMAKTNPRTQDVDEERDVGRRVTGRRVDVVELLERHRDVLRRRILSRLPHVGVLVVGRLVAIEERVGLVEPEDDVGRLGIVEVPLEILLGLAAVFRHNPRDADAREDGGAGTHADHGKGAIPGAFHDTLIMRSRGAVRLPSGRPETPDGRTGDSLSRRSPWSRTCLGGCDGAATEVPAGRLGPARGRGRRVVRDLDALLSPVRPGLLRVGRPPARRPGVHRRRLHLPDGLLPERRRSRRNWLRLRWIVYGNLVFTGTSCCSRPTGTPTSSTGTRSRRRSPTSGSSSTSSSPS